MRRLITINGVVASRTALGSTKPDSIFLDPGPEDYVSNGK